MVGNYHDELKNADKCSLFVIHTPLKGTNIHLGQSSLEIKELHLYIVPISEKTIDFCKFMNIIPTLDHFQKYPSMFAYLINVKHPRYSMAEKISISKNTNKPCLNPEVAMSL